MPQGFDPFLDLTKKSDEDLLDGLSRVHSMIGHYHTMGNSLLIGQLQAWKEVYLNEMQSRAYKKQVEKANKNPVAIDTSDEANEKLTQMTRSQKRLF